jgi:hypothetical protein
MMSKRGRRLQKDEEKELHEELMVRKEYVRNRHSIQEVRDTSSGKLDTVSLT